MHIFASHLEAQSDLSFFLILLFCVMFDNLRWRQCFSCKLNDNGRLFIHVWLIVQVEMRLVHMGPIFQWVRFGKRNKAYAWWWKEYIFLVLCFSHESTQGFMYLAPWRICIPAQIPCCRRSCSVFSVLCHSSSSTGEPVRFTSRNPISQTDSKLLWGKDIHPTISWVWSAFQCQGKYYCSVQVCRSFCSADPWLTKYIYQSVSGWMKLKCCTLHSLIQTFTRNDLERFQIISCKSRGDDRPPVTFQPNVGYCMSEPLY